MEALGLKDMLQNNPDLSVMLPNSEAMVSKITQEAFIDLNEQGVEAAAYTQIDIKETCIPFQDDPVEMIFDRPLSTSSAMTRECRSLSELLTIRWQVDDEPSAGKTIMCD